MSEDEIRMNRQVDGLQNPDQIIARQMTQNANRAIQLVREVEKHSGYCVASVELDGPLPFHDWSDYEYTWHGIITIEIEGDEDIEAFSKKYVFNEENKSALVADPEGKFKLSVWPPHHMEYTFKTDSENPKATAHCQFVKEFEPDE